MKKDKSSGPVVFMTFYLAVYLVLLLYPATVRLAMFMFSISPFLIVWMVIRVLKHGVPSKRKFEDYFYEDAEY